MNPNDIVQLVQTHKWIALSAAVIFTLIRLAKSDTTFPVNISPQYRVWASYVLGLCGAVLQHYAVGGITWTDAIVGGLLSSVLASQTHNMVIGSLRGGKEFAFPGLMIPGARPSPGKPTSIPPKPAEAQEEITVVENKPEEKP